MTASQEAAVCTQPHIDKSQFTVVDAWPRQTSTDVFVHLDEGEHLKADHFTDQHDAKSIKRAVSLRTAML